MDLLEYQAKTLFRQVGIPILPSQTIKDPRQIKQLQIPYPVVLKSQVRAGGRGKAGGVRFVENTIDAIAAARTVFNLPILGEYPEVILAEARYDAHKELFLAIALDYQLQRPVLLGSSSGGMDVKSLFKNLQQVVVETEFSPFYARRLASRMNLSGQLLLSVSKIVEKMYSLFKAKDLELVEINPLGVNSEGQLMALDGKMTINQDALSRHPEIVTLTKPLMVNHHAELSAQNSDNNYGNVKSLDWQDSQGVIAIITNDSELSVASWDLICQAKHKPALAIILDYNFQHDSEIEAFTAEFEDILSQLQSFANIKTVLVNFWSSEAINEAIAKTIFDYCKSLRDEESGSLGKSEEAEGMITSSSERLSETSKKSRKKSQQSPAIKFLVRLIDEEINRYQEEFKTNNIYWTNSLDAAISRI